MHEIICPHYQKAFKIEGVEQLQREGFDEEAIQEALWYQLKGSPSSWGPYNGGKFQISIAND